MSLDQASRKITINLGQMKESDFETPFYEVILTDA